MKGEDDYGIIMSALAMGDLNDVQARIRGRIRKLGLAQKYRPSDRTTAYIGMLEALQSVLEGKISVDDFIRSLENPLVSQEFRFVDNWQDFVSSVTYYLNYYIDRYNIHLPAFDAKRSDDK
ncbi:MAG: hypothetical protein QW597_01060 [Thermoplasmataceae archaeon]